MRGWRRIGQGAVVVAVALASVALRTSWTAPPRFDGAGYAVLAESLRTGRGYRAIDQPDAPRHAHFPPGYPLALAALWRVTGPSEAAAHALSVTCTVGAVALAWGWMRRRLPRAVAWPLALALAVNWSWGRAGGAIQSEPMFLLLSMGLIAAAEPWSRRPGGAVALGLLAAACALTRHVGVMLALAVAVDLLLRRRFRSAVLFGLAFAAGLAPWVAWLATVREGTQLGLVPRSGLVALVGSQILFYVQRIPDQVLGPVVEVGTVFRPAWRVPATIAAAVFTTLVLAGWVIDLRTARRRLVGLAPLLTLALLLAWPFTEAGRFLIPLAPFLLVGAALGGGQAAGRWMGRRRARVAAAWAVLALSLPYSLMSLIGNRAAAIERGQAPFDAACRWIADHGEIPGPVLVRQAGEAWWLLGRSRAVVAVPPEATADDVAVLVARHRPAYLIDDAGRYANAPAGPVGRYAEAFPDRVREVHRAGEVRVLERLKVEG